MAKEKTTLTLEELTERLNTPELMFGIITRAELAKRSGGVFHQKTMANWDSSGKGFKRKLEHKNNKQPAYFIADVLELLRDSYRVVTKAGPKK